jgi:hypothetical protein
MGQYLSIGIIKDIQIEKQKLKDTSFENLKVNFERKGYDLTIFNTEIEGDVLQGRLKTEILEKELLPFLEKVYGLLSAFTFCSDYKDVLKKVSETEDFNALLNNASFYDFQLDKYAHGDRIYIDDFRNKKVDINFNVISFKMAGKIIIESDEGLFDLFASLLRKELADFQLAKALKVYITG